MKNISLISAISASLVILTGCNSTTPTPTPTKQETKALTLKEQQIKSANSLPLWVIHPQSSNGITAVGMAMYSKHGLRVMKPQAEMDARAKLAGQIQTLVSRSQKNAIRLSQVAKVDDMENVFSQSTKETINKIALSGAVVVNQKMVDSGDYYVQMVIKKREVAQELDKAKEIYKKNLQNAKLTKQSVADGMKVLDKMMNELDKDLQ